MAAKNRTFTMTQGAYVNRLGLNLYDAAGQFTITGDVNIYVKRQGADTNAIDGVACNVALVTIEGRGVGGESIHQPANGL